ncbi:Ca-activated chloride channel family protein [Catalinimonas alkaloidigena]|uniref:Ca-activated chloride channel family protein n=1 Tax=Catalinimonas alkaloidigena TaxID=1075417 RepID=A0A1G9K624_9BACT|nr:Ca-activated chloride channel family protein [Catalinimonas alkaloidigena]
MLAQTKPEEPPPTTRILFLLDGSGSMLARMEGNYSRMVVAKRLLSDLVDSLAGKPHLELALRVYGHQFDRRQKNCQDSKLEVGFSANNVDRIKERLRAIVPRGTTPIAYSLEQAARDFPSDPRSRNIVIIITDGLESCDGDPCTVALALQKSRTFLKPFIIGLDAQGNNFADAFACLGQYFEAYDIKTFRQVLDKVMKQTLEPTTLSVELLDSDGKPTETNVNMQFSNSVTGATEYDFYHYLDEKGQTDHLAVDAVLSYDILVRTIPPVLKEDVYLEGGQHNVVRISAPQGALQVRKEGGSPQEQPAVLVRHPRTRQTLNQQTTGEAVKYLVGTYDVEVLTLPRTTFADVKIEQSKTTPLSLPAPGILNVTNLTYGIGSLYVLRSDTENELFYQFQDRLHLNLALQPGNYKIVFRAKSAKGSRFTDVKYFTIKSNQTTNLKLF